MSEEVYGVVVIGGGPAGAVAGATLARAGHSVVICEQATFPRFKIGESLLPAGNAVLQAIGVWEKVERAGFVRKVGADFESADGRAEVVTVFAKGLNPAAGYTYQVERSRFDQLLLEHAGACGAEVLQPVRVVETRPVPGGWTVTLSDGRVLKTHYLIDASGRNAFLGRQEKVARASLPYTPKIAVYGHFRGVSRAPGERGGHIIITRWRNGWFWNIPIDETRTSVGLVAPSSELRALGGDPEGFFRAVAAAAPTLAARMKGAERLGPLHVTSDYTYAHTHFAGSRYFLAGDAACFIDPIFSSGVCLALKSGHEAGVALAEALQKGAPPLSSKVQKTYTRRFQHRVHVMRGLIDTFYDRCGIEVFLSPSSRCQIFEAINTIVGGRTELNWALRWRYAFFRGIVRLQRRFPIVPRLPDEALGQSVPPPLDGRSPGAKREDGRRFPGIRVNS